MTAVTACTNNYTELMSGIAVTYGVWDAGKLNVSDEVRLNIIGNMSGLYEFEQNDSLGLSDQIRESFEKLWWKEAEPDAEEYFKAKKDRDTADWSSKVSELWK